MEQQHEHKTGRSPESLTKPEEGPRAEADRLHDVFHAEGVETQVVEIPGEGEYRHAIIFPHRYEGDEPLVRVYRGVNQLDATLLNQIPYALRSREDNADSLTVLDHARTQVDALTAEPTYENLRHYIDAVWPDLTDKEVAYFAKTLERMENEAMDGMPLRTSLVHETYGYNGGQFADTGMAPYISASTDAREAAAYGRGGMMVIDIPLSKLEAIAARTDGEVAIKGAIPVEYIAAILPRTRAGGSTKESIQRDITGACAVLDARSTHAVLNSEQMGAAFRAIRQTEKEHDAVQHEKDVAAIRERRTGLLLKKFPDAQQTEEVILKLQQEEGVDVYTAAKRAVYDLFATRFERAGGSREDLEKYYVYSSSYELTSGSREKVHYTRSSVTDDMLTRLRDIVIRQEDLMLARQRAEELRRSA